MDKQAPPDLLALSSIEEGLLASRLDAVRLAITHAGEKGRSLEAEVTSILRAFLPTEYGLGTGFIVFHTPDGPRLSRQLDIIIYDALRSGPIVRLSTCDVFPLEAVYGCIEVKAALQSASDAAQAWPGDSIESCIEANGKLRQMTERRFWIPRAGTITAADLRQVAWTAVRSYVFAFSAHGTVALDARLLAQRMADFSARQQGDVHLHGLFIVGSLFAHTRPVDRRTAKPQDFHHIEYTTKHALASFKWRLLHDLARFPRFETHWAPAIDEYGIKTTWDSCAPKG